MQIDSPDPSRANAQALVERRRKRGRRRLAAWTGFLLLGLMLGAIYATGFATTGGATGAEADAAANSNEPAGNEDTSELAGKIETVTADLSYNWGGRWGTVSSAVMYAIDLSSFEASEKFFSEVLLVNTPAGLSDLQLQVRIATPAGASCAVSDLEGTAESNRRVMIFDTDDAQVTFSGMAGATTGLAGEAKYCIGVFNYSGSGKDEGGTFIRKSKPGSDISGITYPEFLGTLNRME